MRALPKGAHWTSAVGVGLETVSEQWCSSCGADISEPAGSVGRVTVRSAEPALGDLGNVDTQAAELPGSSMEALPTAMLASQALAARAATRNRYLCRGAQAGSVDVFEEHDNQ